jgi:hypothetical protein
MAWPKRAWFTKANAAQMGARGGRKTAPMQRAKSVALWSARFPGVPVEVIRTIRKQAYVSGFNQGVKRTTRTVATVEHRAYEQGYRQAQMDAMPRRRTA